MIGKLYVRNGRFVFDCHNADIFADLLAWGCLEHLGGPTFALLPMNGFTPEEEHRIIGDMYGVVSDEVVDEMPPLVEV